MEDIRPPIRTKNQNVTEPPMIEPTQDRVAREFVRLLVARSSGDLSARLICRLNRR
jgi:hypothetical protein